MLDKMRVILIGQRQATACVCLLVMYVSSQPGSVGNCVCDRTITCPEADPQLVYLHTISPCFVAYF